MQGQNTGSFRYCFDQGVVLLENKRKNGAYSDTSDLTGSSVKNILKMLYLNY